MFFFIFGFSEAIPRPGVVMYLDTFFVLCIYRICIRDTKYRVFLVEVSKLLFKIKL